MISRLNLDLCRTKNVAVVALYDAHKPEDYRNFKYNLLKIGGVFNSTKALAVINKPDVFYGSFLALDDEFATNRDIVVECVYCGPPTYDISAEYDRIEPEAHGNVATNARARYMARLRNQYIFALHNEGLGNFDYVIVLDSDITWINEEGLIRTIYHLEENRKTIYTAWGLETPHYKYYDTWALQFNGENYWNNRQRSFIIDEDSIREVESAFGGMAIYPAEAFSLDNLSYGSYIGGAEHTLLHKTMRENGYNIFVSKDLELLR